MQNQQQAWTFDLVVTRLAEAGCTLLRLRVTGVRPAGFRSSMPRYVADLEDEACADTMPGLRPSQPTAGEVTRMDQALEWVSMVPPDMVAHRRIVHARCMTNWATGRPVYSWRAIARKLHIDNKTAKAWHDLAVSMIVLRLNRPGMCAASGGPVGPGPAATRVSSARLGHALQDRSSRWSLTFSRAASTPLPRESLAASEMLDEQGFYQGSK